MGRKNRNNRGSCIHYNDDNKKSQAIKSTRYASMKAHCNYFLPNMCERWFKERKERMKKEAERGRIRSFLFFALSTIKMLEVSYVCIMNRKFHF